eukprot:TRINITY_DN4378_c0_g1_i2.p1 TRINITY_DN4378_c0_g1~~TRINITY_DN4378_c0_g1_i2.p1  ORF type:complete len:815 (+),score=134.69 TRINITY_DN4378_c0_g1_i2:279-2447(+)
MQEASLSALMQLGTRKWSPRETILAITGLRQRSVNTIWDRCVADGSDISDWFRALVNCLDVSGSWPPDDHLSSAIGRLGKWALARNEEELCAILQAVLETRRPVQVSSHRHQRGARDAGLAKEGAALISVVISHLERSLTTAAGSSGAWCWWLSSSPAKAVQPLYRELTKMHNRGDLLDDSRMRLVSYFSQGLQKIDASKLWRAAGLQQPGTEEEEEEEDATAANWWHALAKVMFAEGTADFHDNIAEPLMQFLMRLPVEGWWARGGTSIHRSLQHCRGILGLMNVSTVLVHKPWKSYAVRFIAESLFAELLLGPLKERNIANAFWQEADALQHFGILLSIADSVKGIQTATGVGNWSSVSHDVANKLLQAVPRQAWWTASGPKNFVELVRILDRHPAKLKLLSESDKARSIIPLQGPGRALHTAPQMDTIFKASDRAKDEDLEELLSPDPVMLILHRDFVEALRNDAARVSLSSFIKQEQDLLSSFRQHADITDLQQEDLQKWLTDIAREQKRQVECQKEDAERQLQEEKEKSKQLQVQAEQRLEQERTEKQQLAEQLQATQVRAEQQLQQERTEKRDLTQQLQTAQAERDRAEAEVASLRAQLAALQPAPRRASAPVVNHVDAGFTGTAVRTSSPAFSPSLRVPTETAAEARLRVAMDRFRIVSRLATLRRASATWWREQIPFLMRRAFTNDLDTLSSPQELALSLDEVQLQITRCLGIW